MKNIVARMNREPGTNFLAHVVDAWINRLRDIGDSRTTAQGIEAKRLDTRGKA